MRGAGGGDSRLKRFCPPHSSGIREPVSPSGKALGWYGRLMMLVGFPASAVLSLSLFKSYGLWTMLL